MAIFFNEDDYKTFIIEFESDVLEESTSVQLTDNKNFKIEIRTKYEHNLYEGHRPSFKVVDGDKYAHDEMKGITVYFDDEKGNIGVYPAKNKKIDGARNKDFLDFIIKTNYDNLNKIWEFKPGSNEYNKILNDIISNTGTRFKKSKIKFVKKV